MIKDDNGRSRTKLLIFKIDFVEITKMPYKQVYFSQTKELCALLSEKLSYEYIFYSYIRSIFPLSDNHKFKHTERKIQRKRAKLFAQIAQ